MTLGGGNFFVFDSKMEMQEFLKDPLPFDLLLGTADATWFVEGWMAVLFINNNAGGPVYIFKQEIVCL